MYGLMQMGSMVVAIMAGYLVMAFVLIYIMAVVESRRDGERDPTLGARVATTMMMTISGQMILGGLVAVLGISMEGGRGVEMPLGIIFGAAVGGLPAMLLHMSRLRRPDRQGLGSVERKALGVNAIGTGLAGITLVTVLFTSLFAGEDINGMLVFGTLIYGGASVLTLIPLTNVKASPSEPQA